MSAPQFTPGPWEDVATSRSHSGQWHEIKSGEAVIAEVFDDDTDDGSYPDANEQAANARLIAAAPDLLHALEAARCALHGKLLERADAALAKARGEQVPA